MVCEVKDMFAYRYRYFYSVVLKRLRFSSFFINWEALFFFSCRAKCRALLWKISTFSQMKLSLVKFPFGLIQKEKTSSKNWILNFGPKFTTLYFSHFLLLSQQNINAFSIAMLFLTILFKYSFLFYYEHFSFVLISVKKNQFQI